MAHRSGLSENIMGQVGEIKGVFVWADRLDGGDEVAAVSALLQEESPASK